MDETDNVTAAVANTAGMTLCEALGAGAQQLQGSVTASSDAELLLMRAANCDRTTLLTHPDRQFSGQGLEAYAAFLRRRANHEPIQYILGEQEFYGLRFEVTPAVLIPRPETEHLVEALLARVAANQPLRIADVGTGSGAIAVALAHTLPQAHITAVDISSAALKVARRNAAHHAKDQITFVESDLLTAIEDASPSQRAASFDAIVSNPPYIADTEELELQVRNYEPHKALFAGPTGLEIYQRLIPQAKRLLKPGGWLLVEIGAGQQPAIAELLAGWHEVTFTPDLQNIPRVAAARRP